VRVDIGVGFGVDGVALGVGCVEDLLIREGVAKTAVCGVLLLLLLLFLLFFSEVFPLRFFPRGCGVEKS